MQCKKCGSSDVQVQTINEVQLKDKHHSFLWWIFVGWYWVPIKWLFLTVPALLVKLFIPKKQKAINTQRTICVCQNCGNKWEI